MAGFFSLIREVVLVLVIALGLSLLIKSGLLRRTGPSHSRSKYRRNSGETLSGWKSGIASLSISSEKNCS